MPLSDNDLRWDYFRVSGGGGQRRDKVSTGVRITHLPTGIAVSATERRSREQNRVTALARLEERLALATRPVKKRRPTSPGKAARQRRLVAKKQRGQIKALRQKPVSE